MGARKKRQRERREGRGGKKTKVKDNTEVKE